MGRLISSRREVKASQATLQERNRTIADFNKKKSEESAQ